MESNIDQTKSVPAGIWPQPQPQSPAPAKKSVFWKLFIWIFIVLILAGGSAAYYFKDVLFKDPWMKSMHALVNQYAIDADAFNLQFATLDMSLLNDAAEMQKAEDVLKQSKAGLNKVEYDVRLILSHIDKGQGADSLSAKNRAVKEDFKSCYVGTQKATEMADKGILQSLSYIEALRYLNLYQAEADNFIAVKNAGGIVMRQKDTKASVEAISKIRDSALALKGHLDKMNLIIESDAIQKESDAYRLAGSSFGDMAIAYERKDVDMLNRSADGIKKAGQMIEESRGGIKASYEKWYQENVSAYADQIKQQFASVEAVCRKAEEGAGFRQTR